MHSLLRKYLAFFAKIIIKRKKPFIIGVTGTAGKTTVTSFVVAFLQKEFGQNAVQYSRYHYNGEFGLPLTILGAKTGGKNLFKWFALIFVFLKVLFSKYPRFLVLEYGVDHIGEMDFLLSVAKPDIAIITPIFANHMEQFGTEENYIQEKLKITVAKHILAHQSLFERLTPNSRVVFFGKNAAKKDINVESVSVSKRGTEAKVHFENNDFDVRIPMIGEYQAENILPLFGIAKILGIDLGKISQYSSHFCLESGRSCVFDGFKNSTIIDGTYNGGFVPMIEGMKTARDIAGESRVYILLGDMRELGDFEQQKHEELAQKIIEIFSDFSEVEFFLVGPLMQKYVAPILQKNFVVEVGLSARKIGDILKKRIEDQYKNAIIFAKGSQNTIFLEESIKSILPSKQHEKLCRQSAEWLKKKEIFFHSVEKL